MRINSKAGTVYMIFGYTPLKYWNYSTASSSSTSSMFWFEWWRFFFGCWMLLFLLKPGPNINLTKQIVREKREPFVSYFFICNIFWIGLERQTIHLISPTPPPFLFFLYTFINSKAFRKLKKGEMENDNLKWFIIPQVLCFVKFFTFFFFCSLFFCWNKKETLLLINKWIFHVLLLHRENKLKKYIKIR